MSKNLRVIDGDGHIWEDQQAVMDHIGRAAKAAPEKKERLRRY